MPHAYKRDAAPPSTGSAIILQLALASHDLQDGRITGRASTKRSMRRQEWKYVTYDEMPRRKMALAVSGRRGWQGQLGCCGLCRQQKGHNWLRRIRVCQTEESDSCDDGKPRRKICRAQSASFRSCKRKYRLDKNPAFYILPIDEPGKES
jgi:hypothetical protein